MLASELIRDAVLRHKAQDIPIAVSMANVAASGGYWGSTPADRIFAEPETITGSIGIFAVIPTFEETAAAAGVTSDGVRTTPLSGQPVLIGGFTPETDAILQAFIENGYEDFLDRVGEARGMTRDQADAVGQGRDGEETGSGGDVFARMARGQANVVTQVAADADRLLGAKGAQAYCLACPSPQAGPSQAGAPDGWLARIAALLFG